MFITYTTGGGRIFQFAYPPPTQKKNVIPQIPPPPPVVYINEHSICRTATMSKLWVHHNPVALTIILLLIIIIIIMHYWDIARREFKELLTPSLFQGYSRLGTALSFLKKYPEAEKVFLQGLEHEPNNAQLQGGLEEVQSQLTGDAFSF